MWWVVGVVTVVVVVATYLTWTAARVDRLHARAAAAHAALDAALVRRAAAAAALADRERLPELGQAARVALDAVVSDRGSAENDLTLALRTAVAGLDGSDGRPRDTPHGDGSAGPGHDALGYQDLVAASRRVALARQVHDDMVRDALAVRRQVPVRLLRLTRRHQQPTYFDVDDPTLDPARMPTVE